jgi:hypothetical protein
MRGREVFADDSPSRSRSPPNQVLGFFEFFRERESGKCFVFKGLQKPYRRRSKEIEDAPLAAYESCERSAT